MKVKEQTRSAPGPAELVRELSVFHRIKFVFLMAAAVALMLSVALWFSGEKEQGLYVGLWVPAIHSLGTLVLTGERGGARHE